jgi:hypothetical protein
MAVTRRVRENRDVFEGPGELAALEDLAAETSARAARARSHATGAREQARLDTERGDLEAAEIHRREAVAHERAATANAKTAALYRQRVERVLAARAGEARV